MMQLDGPLSEEVDMLQPHDAVYTADLQVEEEETPAAAWAEEEEEEANVEAGSPASSQQRRRMRAHTMRLRGHAAMFTPAHARGSSDTTSISTIGRIEAGTTMMTPTGFTSINAPRALPSGYHGDETGVEARGIHEDDRMRID
ncbi:hypothetical protein GGR55DRAFT_658411 [Xylaria sp. FL0064]|nr:hypothetical protein GGR55DRAFT_658411 [Xylaria sp. FL0064]